MPSDLFHEAFFFFTRYEAENLRTVCRTFDTLCTGLRDVHGYKLQIDRISISCANERTSNPGPSEFFALIWAYGQRTWIQGSEEDVAARVKAALSVSLVHDVYICNSALNESLCGAYAAFFAGVSAEINFLLSFDAIGEMQLYTRLQEDDLADEFILRCRAKRISGLKFGYGVELGLQEGSADELLQRYRAIKTSLVSTSR